MLESFNFLLPRGIILPNIFSIKVLLTLPGLSFLKMLIPQKVKNMVTLPPMAAAPFAMIKEAMALSNSPEKTTIVLLLSVLQLGSTGTSQTS